MNPWKEPEVSVAAAAAFPAAAAAFPAAAFPVEGGEKPVVDMGGCIHTHIRIE